MFFSKRIYSPEVNAFASLGSRLHYVSLEMTFILRIAQSPP